ncbi:hypothetical protein ACROYT_G019108 [Oculina patagonica]
MAACLLWLRAPFSRISRCSIPGTSKAHVINIICRHSTQASPTASSVFQPLPREELVTKFKSRLKDRPFTVGSTGEGFPEFLGEPRESFPHGVQVNNPHQSSLAELTAKCMEYVEKNHAQHPAILFRNLPAQTAQDFSTIAKEIPWKRMTYEGGTSFRQEIDKSVGTYTANDDPDEITIDPHNEMSYAKVYPSKIFFFCLKEPADGCGGETPLIKNSELLSKLDPEVVRRFEEKQVRYVRYVPDKSNDKYMNWQHVFDTDDRQVAEARAKEQGNNITWDPNGDLYFWQTRPACIHRPKTGEKIWFNQATSLNGQYYQLFPERAEIPDHKQPHHTYYGDGSDIEPVVLQHMLATTWQCAVGFKWKKGDLLVLDNLAVQHGRLGFKGERKLLVYMTV